MVELLKHDSFGKVEIVEREGRMLVRRSASGGKIPGSRWLARMLARREQKTLRLLATIPGIPRAFGESPRGVFYRSFIPGEQLDSFEALESEYFDRLFALMRSMHEAGVAHNDLAKEANILVTPERRPALVDFQLACRMPAPRAWLREKFFAMLCREDRRHLLKQKAVHRPDLLIEEELRAIARKSLPAKIWWHTGRKLYHGLTRPLGWRDREGRGKRKGTA